MENKYKLPIEVRNKVKQELYEYKKNKKRLENINEDTGIDTRALLIAYKRIEQIETVLNSLNKEDREAAELIFISKCKRERAEVEQGISKAAYYNVMNKVIYLVALEMDLYYEIEEEKR